MAEATKATSVDFLLDQLKNSKDVFVRKWAANLLGEQHQNNKPAIAALKTVAISDTNKSVRDAARDSLKKSGISIELSEKDKLSNTFWWAAFLIPDLLVLILYALFGE